jgi:hypothetical protein
MVKLCKICGHKKSRHVRPGRNWPVKCIDCNDFHYFEEKKEEVKNATRNII